MWSIKLQHVEILMHLIYKDFLLCSSTMYNRDLNCLQSPFIKMNSTNFHFLNFGSKFNYYDRLRVKVPHVYLNKLDSFVFCGQASITALQRYWIWEIEVTVVMAFLLHSKCYWLKIHTQGMCLFVGEGFDSF